MSILRPVLIGEPLGVEASGCIDIGDELVEVFCFFFFLHSSSLLHPKPNPNLMYIHIHTHTHTHIYIGEWTLSEGSPTF